MEIENIDNIRELAKIELEEYFVKLKEDYPFTDFKILRAVKAMYKIHKFWIDVIPNIVPQLLHFNFFFCSISIFITLIYKINNNFSCFNI